MSFEAKDYYEAARERHSQAQYLLSRTDADCQELNGKRYALIVYLAGVAIESLFRAFIRLVSSKFDGRHYIPLLFEESGLLDRLEAKLQHDNIEPAAIDDRLVTLEAAVNDVADIWSNDYRYASDRVLVKILIERRVIDRKMNKGNKQNVLRSQAVKLLNSTKSILAEGEVTWPN